MFISMRIQQKNLISTWSPSSRYDWGSRDDSVGDLQQDQRFPNTHWWIHWSRWNTSSCLLSTHRALDSVHIRYIRYWKNSSKCDFIALFFSKLWNFVLYCECYRVVKTIVLGTAGHAPNPLLRWYWAVLLNNWAGRFQSVYIQAKIALYQRASRFVSDERSIQREGPILLVRLLIEDNLDQHLWKLLTSWVTVCNQWSNWAVPIQNQIDIRYSAFLLFSLFNLALRILILLSRSQSHAFYDAGQSIGQFVPIVNDFDTEIICFDSESSSSNHIDIIFVVFNFYYFYSLFIVFFSFATDSSGLLHYSQY